MSVRARLWTVVVSLLLLSAACTDSGVLTPRSSGRPYEVLLVGDTDSTVFRMLDINVPGLPQQEPMFDIMAIPAKRFLLSQRLARAIVIVETDAQQYTRPALRYEKNVDAKPQLVIHVQTPSAEALRQHQRRLATALQGLLERFEMDVAIADIKRHCQLKAGQTVCDFFGKNICIPADLGAMKQGDGFLWLSNHAATGMENICVYRLPVLVKGTSAQLGMTTQWLTSQRDSIMKRNIPGERNGMYMQTVATTVTTEQPMATSSMPGKILFRGLWEMHGDAMGGPFVLCCLPEKDSVLVVEAFVYAPESRKRNKLKRLEAVLYTISDMTPRQLP